MTDSNGTPTHACCWLAALIDTDAYPRSAGVTLNAVEAMRTQKTFSRAQLAYVAALAFAAGTSARTAAEDAEAAAACEAHFAPRETRDARIARRMAEMADAHEIAHLRQYGRPPEQWDGPPAPMTAASAAAARYGWEATRPDPVVPRGRLYVRADGSWDDDAPGAFRTDTITQ